MHAVGAPGCLQAAPSPPPPPSPAYAIILFLKTVIYMPWSLPSPGKPTVPLSLKEAGDGGAEGRHYLNRCEDIHRSTASD